MFYIFIYDKLLLSSTRIVNKKIKLYIFSPYSFIGGDTLSISRLINNLDSKNYDISFICLKKTRILNYLKKKNFEIKRINSTRTIFSFSEIKKIIKKDMKKNYKKYIFLSNQNFANVLSVIFLKRIKKLKIVLIERNHIDEFKYNQNIKNFFIKVLMKIFYKKTEKIIGISKKLSKDLSSFVNSKVYTIYNPSYDKKIYNLSNKKIKFTQKKNLILSVGRFEKQKDIFTILRAFLLVINKIEANLLLIGYGSQLNEIQKFIKENKIKKRVKLLTNVNNPHPYYKFAKIFILASKYEGFGNVIVEAGMFKIPIIASDCNSGPREILLNGKGGSLFPVGNSHKLAKLIIDNITKKNNTKIKILFNSLNRFNIKTITKKYKNIFENI